MTLGPVRLRTMTQQTTSGSRIPERAGAAVRTVGKGFPGIVGPLLVCAGLWLAWPPLGVIALGLILWALDRRVS